MADINEILGRQINSVKELKAAIKELQDSLVGVDAESEQFKTTSEQLAAAQAELNKVTRAGKDDTDAAADSIRGMEKEYKALYDTYKMLSDEQRNSDFGKNMAESLSKLSETINDTKKEVGNFTSNIGRYAQGATEVFSQMGISLGALQTPMKLASGGAKTLGKELKTLIANPVGMVIMGIVVAFKAMQAIVERVKKAIQDNEETQNRLTQAMAVFRPILDGVTQAFDWLAKVVVGVIEGLAKVAEKIMSIIPGMKQAIQSHKDLAKATNELTKATREANVENSKKQAEIERLREEASATEDVTEKKRLLEEAKAMQAEVDQKNIELAQEELRIMQEYAEKTANSAAENEKLAAAQKKVNDAIAHGEANMRMYNEQLSATETKTKSAGGAAVDYRKKAKELYEQLIEDNKDEITKLTEKYEKEKKLLEKYHLDTTLLTKKYNKEIAAAQKEIDNKAADALRKQLGYRKEAYEEAHETLELNNKMWTEEARLVKRIQEVENLKPNETRFDQLYNLRIKKAIEHDYPEIIKALDLAVEHDLTSLTDYDKILNRINDKIELYKEKQPSLSEEWKKTYDYITKIGETNWVKMTEGLELEAVKLKTDFEGLDLGSMLKLSLSIEDFKKNELPKLYDALADIKIDDAIKEATKELFTGEFYDGLLTEGLQTIHNVVAENEYAILDAERTALEAQLDNFKGTEEKKIELLQEYYSVVDEMRNREAALEELDVQRRRQIWDDAFDSFISMANSTNTILESIVNVRQAQMDADLKEGKISQQEYDKKKKSLEKLEKLEVAVAVAGIAANTAAGIIDVWRGYAAELPLNAATAAAAGPGAAAVKAALDAKSLASAIIRTTTLTVEGGAQIAAAVGGYIAKSTAASSEAGSGDVSVGATPAMIDSTPYSYTRTVQTQEDVDRLNQPIWVSVVDVENALGQQAVVRDESSF